ncbi:hypothetical protein AAY473_003929 [Plecturocebus cupreus]
MSEMSVNTTAGMLKLCFRELPSPSSLTSSTPTSLKASASPCPLLPLGAVKSEMWEPELCHLCRGRRFNQPEKAGARTEPVLEALPVPRGLAVPIPQGEQEGEMVSTALLWGPKLHCPSCRPGLNEGTRGL